jgi:hypothetical protein
MYQDTTLLHGYTVDTSADGVAIGTTEVQVSVPGVYMLQAVQDANSDGPVMVKIAPTSQNTTFSTNNAIVISANNSPIVLYVQADSFVRANAGCGMLLMKKVTSA